MKTLVALFALCFSSLNTFAQTKEGEFWLIRGDHRMADALINAVSEKKLSTTELSDRISLLIKQRKLTELAKFTRNLGNDSVKMEKQTGEVKVREINETIRMGIFLEAEATFSDTSQAVDMRFVAEIYEKDKGLRYHFKNVIFGVTLTRGAWQLLHHWKNESESTLLLSFIPSKPKTTNRKPFVDHCIRTDVELLETTPFNLKKFNKSTPETQTKALEWLRGRSKLLVSTTITTRSGEKAIHQDQLQVLFNNTGWDTARLGFHFEIETSLGRLQKKLDLSISAEWQDPEKFKETPDYQFTFAQTVPTNKTTVIEPTTAPEKSPKVIVLVLTPRAQQLAGDSPTVANSKRMIPEGLSTQTYAVEPSFYRKMNDKHPGEFRKPLKELLQLQGMAFPEKTFVNYIATKGVTVLRHNKAGHLAFQKILTEISDSKP